MDVHILSPIHRPVPDLMDNCLSGEQGFLAGLNAARVKRPPLMALPFPAAGPINRATRWE
ncbi:MAG: hypothetical protein V3U07_08270 [Nitrospirales bacterium]